MHLRFTLFAALLIGCSPTQGEPDIAPNDAEPAPELPTVILDPQTGDPGLGSVDHITFGPAGHLFVGDGANDRLVVFSTGDVTLDETADDWEKIGNLYVQVGDALGVDQSDTVVLDVTVNPMSGRTYVAAALQDGSYYGVFTVTSDGKAQAVDLAGLEWVAVEYPEVQGAGSVVTEIEATSGWVVAAVTEQSWTASTLVTLPLPITHGDAGSLTTTRTYHRVHTQWETFAPITAMFSFEDDDGAWIGASYQCAPVVRFEIEELAAGNAETIGVTPFDYGGGRQVLDFAVLGTGDDAQVFASVSNLGGTSIEPSLFLTDKNVDEQAPVVFDFSGNPDHKKVDNATKLDEAIDLAVQDETRLVRFFNTGRLSIVDAPSR